MRVCQFLYAAMFFALLSVNPAMAQERHVALDTLANNGYDVTFIGNDFGVDGWMVSGPDGGVQYAYETPEGGLVMGILFASDGSLQTAKQIEQFKDVLSEGSQEALAFNSVVEETNAPLSEKIYAEVEKSKWFAVGDSDAPYIYTFMNPTCEHCITFWNDHMKQHVDAGQLQIRFVPFGSADENREAAAVLLTADNAAERWRAYADGDKDAYDAQGLKIPEGIYDAIDVNSGIFAKRKMNTVPFSIYRAPVDGQVKVIAGIPENTMILLADFVR